MNDRMIAFICREVYQRHPELLGVRPKIQIYGSENARTSGPSPKYLLVFKGKGETASQKSIPLFLRVVVNDQGKILRMSMSR